VPPPNHQHDQHHAQHNGAKQPALNPKRLNSFQARNEPILTTKTLSLGLLIGSIGAAIGSLYLVSQDGKEQIASRSYISVPQVEVSRRFSTSGSAGAAVTIEAFSVGEQITPAALMLRYAFDEKDLEKAPANVGTTELPSSEPEELPEPSEEVEQIVSRDSKHPARHVSDSDPELAALTASSSSSAPSSGAAPSGPPKPAPTKQRNQMQVIGKGAYGRVVRALDRSTGRKVAMKVVPHTAMSAEALLEEVEVLRRVRGHDNIIHLIDVMYCCGKYYVVTELCEGGEVLDHLIYNGPFKEDAASSIMSRVASALQHIHKCGYVHLDIKPENLVFATKKSVDDCRIIDFGMAAKISEVAGQLSMVRGDKGSRVGTLAYWSPEQVASVVGKDGRNLSDMDRDVVRSDPRACDMWALGILLYIMLLGCHPFDPQGRGDEREMARAILKGKFRFDIHGEKLRLSEDAKNLIRGLLDPNPETRFTSRDVLEHPFIKRLKKKRASGEEDYDELLPTSWTQQGYRVVRNTEADKRVGTDTDARLKPFSSQRYGEAFARVLLMAVGVQGRSVYEEDAQAALGENEITSERLFHDAFNMFDLSKRGTLSPSAVERLLQSTGDEAEDDVVVSYRDRTGDGRKTKSSDAGGGINYDEFKAYLRKLDCVTRSFKAGECVFRQGSIPQGFYVLLNGKARLEYKELEELEAQGSSLDGEDSRYSYAILEPGSIFGEAALVQGQKRRSATVRCTKPSEVLFVPKDIFLGALAGSPALNEVIFRVAMKQQAKRLHGLVEHLRPQGLVVKYLSPGQVLFHQGERADFMYLIQEGLVGSNTSAPSSRARGAEDMAVKLAERGPGDLIGTSAATGGGGTRYSTAKCITPVTVIGIPMPELTRLRRDEPVFRFYLENLIQARKEFWQSQIADIERGVSEPQLLPLLLRDDLPEATVSGAVKPQPPGADEGNIDDDGDVPADTPSKSDEQEVPVTDDESENESENKPSGSRVGRALWATGRATVYVLDYANPISWYRSARDWYATPPFGKEELKDKSTQYEVISEDLMSKHVAAFEQFAEAVNRMERRKFSAGEAVVKCGEKPSHFFIVDTGSVSIEFVSEDGKKLSLAHLGPGDHFGEQSLMENVPAYATTIRCVSDADILMMPQEDFFRLVGDGSTTFGKAVVLAMRLRQHRWVRNLLKLAKEDKRARRVRANEQKRKDELEKRRVRKDISEYLGMIERDEDEDTFTAPLHHFVDRDNKSAEEALKDSIREYSTAATKQHSREHTDLGGVTRLIMQPGDLLFREGEDIDAVYMVHRGGLELCENDTGVFHPSENDDDIDDPNLSSRTENIQLNQDPGPNDWAPRVEGFLDKDRRPGCIARRQFLVPGDTLGLEQIMSGSKYQVSAVCTQRNTIVSKVPKHTLKLLIEDHDYVSQQLRRHARRSIPMNELERRAGEKIQHNLSGSYSYTMKQAMEKVHEAKLQAQRKVSPP